jgi:hypothetical protein
MSLQPRELELKTSPVSMDRTTLPVRARELEPAAIHDVLRAGETPAAPSAEGTAAAPSFLAVPPRVMERLSDPARRVLERAAIELSAAPVSDVIASIKKEWQNVSRELAPIQVPAPSPVFRVGVHVFAVREMTQPLADMSGPSPALRDAVTRPVGIGDLQVVRQSSWATRRAKFPISKTSSKASCSGDRRTAKRSAS